MDKKIAVKKLMDICSRQEKCSFDILKKLSEWEFNENTSNKILQELIDNKYVDDKRYAMAFANDKMKFNRWGKLKIAFALKSKNISQQIIDIAILSINNDEYLEMIKSEIAKKIKSIKETDYYKKKAKILRFGQSRGYEIDVVKVMYSRILENKKG